MNSDSMENYKDIIGSLPDPIMVIGNDCTIRELISQPGDIFHDSRESLINPKIQELLPPDAFEEYSRNVGALNASGGRLHSNSGLSMTGLNGSMKSVSPN